MFDCEHNRRWSPRLRESLRKKHLPPDRRVHIEHHDDGDVEDDVEDDDADIEDDNSDDDDDDEGDDVK